jgi:hypothetical protein
MPENIQYSNLATGKDSHWKGMKYKAETGEYLKMACPSSMI